VLFASPEGGSIMNKDVLAAKWIQLRGQVRQQWGRLTDNELDQVHGRWEKLVGLLQERYAYTKGKAEAELNAFLERVLPRMRA
jgi:uncharacterized protein YjbJ (UPF0337 family)